MATEDARPATPLDHHHLDSLGSQHNVTPPPGTSSKANNANTSPESNSKLKDTFAPSHERQHQHHHHRHVSPELTRLKTTSSSYPSTPPNCPVPAFRPGTEDNVKRDSAIDHSTPNGHCSPPAFSPLSSLHGVNEVIESPNLPSILVHDAPPKSSRSNRSFLRSFSRDSYRPALPLERPASAGHQRIPSFHGIEMEIPSDSGLDDLNQPEKLQFSKRGSVLLNGKKLDALAAARKNNTDSILSKDMDSPTLSSSSSSSRSPSRSRSRSRSRSHSHSRTPSISSASNAPAKGTGLKTGRRQPSVHLLQAVLQGSRVMSAEEATFSQRVRIMYDYGDEKAAQWSSPVLEPSPVLDEASSPQDQDLESDMSAPGSVNPQRRPRPMNRASSINPDARRSFIEREPTERAGGIEDWDALAPGAVDRYGFINPTRILSTDTAGTSILSPSEHRPGLQRVSTSLQMLSNSPRQTTRRHLLRGPSSAMNRYSRSLPPTRATSRATAHSTSGGASIYSFQSNHSSTRVQNPFRSRTRRALDNAPDMLTLPPNLSNINETGMETDPYQERMRRREWSRDKKWQDMATPVPSTAKGGGMKFDFNIHDPKLISRTWKGIPDRWRATAWHSFLSTSVRKRGNYPTDETLIRMFAEYQEENSADDVQIDVDVPRTISMHIMFRRRYRGGQRLLFRVLHAISLHFPTTGYVQGMAALAATLLCYYDEEMAFVMLVRMWQLRGLEELYKSGFEGLMTALQEFSTHWLSNDPEVSGKLLDLGIDPTAYGTRWYLTLFNMSLPFAAQLRVWDVFILLGDASNLKQSRAGDSTHFASADLSVLHATGCAIVEAMRAVLVDSDFENSMKSLTSWVPIKDEDLLMRVARAEWKIGMRNRKREGRIMS